MQYLLGIDIGGTTVKIGLVSYAGVIIDKFEIKTNIENNGASILSDIRDAIYDFLNEKVDKVTLSYGGVSKQIKLLREDGPSIYSYNKSSGEISVAEPDEITPGLELFLYTVENTVKICVIFVPWAVWRIWREEYYEIL